MIIARIQVNGVCARVLEKKPVPAKIVGAQVAFEFDSQWEGLQKNVVFEGCCTRGILNAGNVVTIPAEVVAEPCEHLAVGVYGVNAEAATVLPTHWADLGMIWYSADFSGDPSADPTLPVWAQIEKRVGKLEEERESWEPTEDGEDGEDGGFYIPTLKQVDEDTLEFAFSPSKADMPAVAPVQVELPAGQGGDADLTPELKTALVNYYTHVMPNFDDANGLAYINAILTALGAENRVEPEEPDEPVVPDEPDEPETPVVTLTGISATYSGGDVAVGTALTDLTGIEVIATYSDGSVEVVTGYTLSGTIAEGNNTITVSYGGKTATFTVTGVAESADLTIAMSERTSVGSGGVAYSGGSTDAERLLTGNVGHGWTSEKVFENDTAVHVVLTVSSTTYTNFVAGSAADAVAVNDLILYHAVKFGGEAWKNSGDFEIDVTVKAGFRLGVFGSHSCEHVTVSATEV